MAIEHAERFGLSQLHQLRGRVGRGVEESFCLLMADPKSQEAKIRIKAMLDYTDGFKIAEIDLKLRGPGEFFGVRQSGLPEFRMADIVRDEKILRVARTAAVEFIEEDYASARDFWGSQRKAIKSS
jgi:ATP-dependent DNA helicase RecG